MDAAAARWFQICRDFELELPGTVSIHLFNTFGSVYLRLLGALNALAPPKEL